MAYQTIHWLVPVEKDNTFGIVPVRSTFDEQKMIIY